MTFDEVMKALGGGVPQELAEAVFGEDPKMTIGALRASIEARAREAQRYRLVGPPMLPGPYGNGPIPAAEAFGIILGEVSFDHREKATVEAAAALIGDQHSLIVELSRATSEKPVRAGDRLPGGLVAVPVVPTQSMRNAGESGASFGIGKAQHDEAIVLVWDEMLRATGVEIPYPR